MRPPAVTNLQDFVLLLERTEEEVYRAKVVSSAYGEASHDFRLPSSPEERARLAVAIGGSARSYAEEAARRLGASLFEAVFSGQVRTAFEVSLRQAADRGEGLRLRLRFGSDVPDLARLPWEVLYHHHLGPGFLGASPAMPIVRYLELPQANGPLAVEPPIRLLVAVASPSGVPRLEAEEEWDAIQEALAPLQADGRLTAEPLLGATVPALRRSLQEGPWHALHFIGHGQFDPHLDDGILVLEGEDGGIHKVSAQQLGWLLEGTDLRLVVLNACHGARGSPEDCLLGMAQALVRHRIPAVVAMQYPLTGQGAVTFARHFYQAVAAGRPVDAAVAEARREMHLLRRVADWAAPVLFLRAKDGRIFEVGRGGRAGPGPAAPEIDEPQPSADAPEGAPPAPRRRRRWPLAAAAAGLLAAGTFLFLRLVPGGRQEPAVSANPPRAEASHSRCPNPSGVGMQLVWIEPGTFRMGSERAGDDAETVHEVTLTRSFCISAHEVTQRQWEAVLGEEENHSAERGADLPVERVSWQHALRFVDELNRRIGEEVFRLPTEDEWEYAARAGSDTAYSFGDDPAQLPRHGNCKSSGPVDDGFDGTAPVGSFPPNRFGLYDVHGNVWEWVDDRHSVHRPEAGAEPPARAGGERRIRRGGSYDNPPDLCRSAARLDFSPDRRDKRNGLRVVREPLEE